MLIFTIMIVNIIIFCYLKTILFSDNISGKRYYWLCWTHTTCPSCNLMSVAVTRIATGKGRVDSMAWTMAEYNDPVFMFLYVINNIFRDTHKKNGVICDTNVRVIRT